MNGEMLSQDEIDALLRGESPHSKADVKEEATIDVSAHLSEIQQDALGEVGNISFGSSATALSTLLNQKVEITTPFVSIIHKSNLENEFPHPYVAIQVEYTAGFSGVNILAIKQSDAAVIADLMLGGNGSSPSQEMGDLHLSAVQEAMNQMMGSAATSMSSVFNKKIDISPPSIQLLDVSEGKGISTIPDDDPLVKVSFNIRIGSLIDSNIMQVLPIPFAKELVEELFSQNNHSLAENKPTVSEELEADVNNDIPYTRQESEIDKSQKPSYIEQEQQSTQSDNNFTHEKTQADHQTIQNASFSELQDVPVNKDMRNLDMLLDIPLNVTVELGRSRRTVQDILELGTGSIIELDKLAGEPVDILVNDRLIAKGEVVVIDENFGVRVTDIVSQFDRLKKLK